MDHTGLLLKDHGDDLQGDQKISLRGGGFPGPSGGGYKHRGYLSSLHSRSSTITFCSFPRYLITRHSI